MVNRTAIYLNAILLYSSLALFVVPLRLLGIFNTATVIIPITLIIGLFIVFETISRKRIRVTALELLVVISIIPSFLIGAFNGNPIHYIVSDAFKIISWIAIINYFRNADLSMLNQAQYFGFVKLLLIATLSTAFVVTLLKALGWGLKASGSDIVSVFALSVFMAIGTYGTALLTTIGIVMGGKVGATLSAIAAWLLYYFIRPFRGKLKLAGLVTLLILCSFFFHESLPIVSKINPGRLGDELTFEALDRLILGGRILEIQSAIDFLPDDFRIFGGGLGYVYEYAKADHLEVDRHGVHFSPVSVYVIYGFHMVIILTFYFGSIARKGFAIIRSGTSVLKTSCAIFFFANLVNSVTVFSIFSVLLFPLSIGVILNNEKNNCRYK